MTVHDRSRGSGKSTLCTKNGPFGSHFAKQLQALVPLHDAVSHSTWLLHVVAD